MNCLWTKLLAACLLAMMGQAVAGAAEGTLWATNVPRFQIEMSPQAVASLRRDSRADVWATWREGTNVWRDVAVHLKGSLGSFRPIDDRPSFTASFDAFVPDQRFHEQNFAGRINHPRRLQSFRGNDSRAERPTGIHPAIGAEVDA